MGVAWITWVLSPLSVYLYVYLLQLTTRRELPPESYEPLARAAVVFMPVLHGLLTLVAARMVSMRAEGRFVLHGLAVGLGSVVVSQIIGLAFDPFSPEQAARYLLLAFVGGWIGGLWGRAAQARHEALFRASREIGAAENPHEVAAAIGVHLAAPNVTGITLWHEERREAADGGPSGLVLLASWTPDGERGWPPGTRLAAGQLPDTSARGGRGAFVARAGEPLVPAGAAPVLLVPLMVGGGVRVGLLAVSFRRRSRPFGGMVRDLGTAGAQAALALENMRLVQEARLAGREAGVKGERQRMAAEIHDTLAQGFNSIVVLLETAAGRLPPGSEGARHTIDLARTTARESLGESRRLVWALRPEALDRHSLPDALAMLARRWSEETGVPAGFSQEGIPEDGTAPELAPEVEAALLRAGQEALSNARKYADASRVMLTLTYLRDSVVLDYRDDGVGFNPLMVAGEVRDRSSGGYGLRAMRERISQLNGSVEVESAPGEGTSLAVELPIMVRQREEAEGARVGEGASRARGPADA
jgi:putative membrane protein (TIGR04086 family)